MAWYSAAVSGLVPAAAATDIFTVTGSSTKDVGVLRIVISGSATSATIQDFLLIKRSTADSGGTSTTPTIVANDSADAAATAVVRAYTANPTTGTTAGNVKAVKSAVPSATTPAFTAATVVFDYAAQPVVLHGTSEVLAVNLNGATITGGSLDVYVELVEL